MPTVKTLDVEVKALKHRVESNQAKLDREIERLVRDKLDEEVERLVGKKLLTWVVRFGIVNVVAAFGLAFLVYSTANSVANTAATTKAENVANTKVDIILGNIKDRTREASDHLREAEKQTDKLDNTREQLTKALENAQAKATAIDQNYSSVLKDGTPEDYKKKVDALNKLSDGSKEVLISVTNLTKDVREFEARHKMDDSTLKTLLDDKVSYAVPFRMILEAKKEYFLTSFEQDYVRSMNRFTQADQIPFQIWRIVRKD